MAEGAAYAVCIHFDSASGMVYEQGQNLDWRRAKTVCRPEWWAHRLRLLRQLVFPALARQTWQHFDVWCFFDKRDADLSAATRKFCADAGAHCTDAGPAALRQHYRKAGALGARQVAGNGLKWLVVVHQDSDDMYGPGALQAFAEQQPREGQAWHFDQGYVFGLDCGRLALFNANKGGPPPFHAMCYTTNSLVDGNSWQAYRSKWRLAVFHHELLSVPRLAKVPGRHFCVTVHGGNTTTSWTNPHTKHHTGRELTEQDERHAVAQAFGLAGWKQERQEQSHGS